MKRAPSACSAERYQRASMIAVGDTGNERTVVVVEDDPSIADLIDLYLRRANFRVLHAGTGERALQLIEQPRPAIVLLDIGLPDIVGFEVCRRIRTNNMVPVLFLTA